MLNYKSFLLLAISMLINTLAFSQIIIDGKFDDWEGIEEVTDLGDTDPDQLGIESMAITNDANRLFIKVTLDREFDLLDSENVTVFIDADNNPETGFLVKDIGAEISYYFGGKNGYINFPDEFISVGHDELGIVPAPTVTSTTFEFAVNRGFPNDIGPMSLGANISIIIRNSAEANGDHIPNAKEGIQYQWDYQNSIIQPYSLDKEDGATRIVTYNVENEGLLNEEQGSIQLEMLNAINPDIIAFQELFADDSEVENLLNSSLDSEEQWTCQSFGSDVMVCTQSSIIQEGGDQIDNNMYTPLVMDDGNLILINAHLPCCDNDDERQAEIDNILATIKNEDFNFFSEEPVPIMIVGDLNLVGQAQNLTSLLTGDIVDEGTYGSDFDPDIDGSDFINPCPLTTGIPYGYTWNNSGGSYPKGILDYIIYGGDYLKSLNTFVFATEGLAAGDRFSFGLDREDSENASDHYPVVMDFTFDIDQDDDGFTYQEDCNDTDANINPDAEEIPNNDIDEDCDGVANQIDEDEDGFNSDDDCDDTAATTNPDAAEIVGDGVDNNCDGNVDETYLEWPWIGWKQTYFCSFVYDPSFFSEFEATEYITQSNGKDYVNGAYRSENGIVYGWIQGEEVTLFDFTVKAGDTILLPSFSGFDSYIVQLKSKVFDNVIGQDVWEIIIIKDDGTQMTWYREGIGIENNGLNIYQSGFEGGCGHICTRDTDNRRIYQITNNSLGFCGCDFIHGVDTDNDGYSNHSPNNNTILTFPNPTGKFDDKHLRCDTMYITLDFEAAPYIGSEANGCDNILLPFSVPPNGETGFVYQLTPEMLEGYDRVYFTDQCEGYEGFVDLYDCVEEDCDDTDPTLAEDCNQIIDADQDGFGADIDCDDNNPNINPDAMEIENNDIDENCDGIFLFIDEDQDGFNSDEDCDDADASINPDAIEIENNDIDENCDGIFLIIDEDQDGFNSDEDCDDTDANINPDAEEIENNDIDENCDGIFLIIDEDQDGFNSDEDCDDTDPNTYPGAPELCDAIDNNCDGNIDEDVTLITYYADLDMDGYGDSDNFSEECNQPLGTSIQGGDCDDNNPNINPDAMEIENNDIDENCDGIFLIIDIDEDGFNSDEDCDDTDANTYPGAPELCDTIDNNCDGSIDEGIMLTTYYVDQDMDGYGESDNFTEECNQPPGTSTLGGDCDDADANINPDAEEIQNNDIDENCDGIFLIIDEDQDGFHSDEDCDDADANTYPGAPELCDAIDNNCDGSIDEGIVLTTYYLDFDMDGYGNPNNFSAECDQPPGTSIQAGDCDDSDANINPDAEEIPNNDIDENCDGEALQTYYDFLQTGWRQGFEQRIGDGGGGISSMINNHYIIENTVVDNETYRILTIEGSGSIVGQLFRFDNGKIYQKSLTGPEQLYFDFTANVGDSIQITGIPNPLTYVVESKEFTQLLNGQEVRRLGLRQSFEPEGTITDYWLEGVGYEDSGLINSIDFEGGGRFHICTSQEETILFDETIIETVDCDYIIGSYTVDDDNDGYYLAEDCNDEDEDINPDAEDLPNNGIDEDCDGEDTISSIIEPKTFTYSIYPNPLTDNLMIDINSDEVITIQIFDVTGNLLYNSPNAAEENTIDMSDLSSGIYLVKLSTDIESIVKRIIKM